jgi:hypothetical protein
MCFRNTGKIEMSQLEELEELKEILVSDVLMYLDSYSELPSDDLFALRIDLTQIIIDRIDEAVVSE